MGHADSTICPARSASVTHLRPAPAGHVIAVTQDTLLETVHFFAGTPAPEVGYKSAAVNLSDLAAMGAMPAWLNVVVHGEAQATGPERPSRAAWLQAFKQGFASAAAATPGEIQISVETTTADALRVTVVAGGHVPQDQALTRSGVNPGDLLGVTGTLGDAGAALALAYGDQLEPDNEDHGLLRARLDRPTPRVAAGLALRGIASAAMDLSDGLGGDIAHLMQSGVGMYIDARRLPLSPALLRVMGAARARELALGAGDDYELLVAVPKASRLAAETAMHGQGLRFTWIGEATASGSLEIEGGSGDQAAVGGFTHF